MSSIKLGVYDFLDYRSSFPQCRIQKLMNLDKYCGLTSHVLVESAFIELSSSGLPVQQLFLGLTDDELIFVQQEISPNADIKNKNDLELEGLLIDAIFPLSNIIISLSDVRPMTFSVTTPAEQIHWFEICKLDAGFRTQWNVWEKLLNDAIEKQNANNSRYLANEAQLDSKNKMVRSASLSSSYDSSRNESDMSLSSADLDHLKYVSKHLGVAPCRRLRFLYGGHPTIYSATCSYPERQTAVVKSSSWSDVTSCCKESTRTLDMAYFQKVLKRRDKVNKHSTESSHVYTSPSDTSSEEGDIDTLITEVTTNQQKKDNVRSGAQLWGRARELVLGKSNSMTRLVIFQAVSARKKPIARCIQDCNPLDVALELTVMSKRLIMTIRPSDLEFYRATITQMLPTSIQRISHHGDTLRKCVMAEIIANSVLTDRVSALVFFIRVCHHLLYTQRDFQSLICVLQGMASLPVYRLRDTWATLFVQHPLQFSEFQAIASILSPVGHYKSYRSRVDLCRLRNTSYIPWLDHYFLHCKGRKRSSQNDVVSVLMPLTTNRRINAAVTINSLHENNISTDTKSKANVQPFVQPNDTNYTEPLKSILKKEKIKKKKVNGIQKLFKSKKQKTVKFLLSENELERSLAHETEDHTMKHLAKTKLKHSIHNESLNRNMEATPSIIEGFAEETSKAILDEALGGTFQFNTIDTDVKPYSSKEVRGFITVNKDVKPSSNKAVKGRSQPKRKGQGKTGDDGSEVVVEVNNRPTKVSMVKSWMKKKISQRKESKKTKEDIKHVNRDQTEIDATNTLLQGLEQLNGKNTDMNEHKLNVRSVTKTHRIEQNDTKIGKTVSVDKTITKKDGLSRRKSYVPASVALNRRKSLFATAYDERKDDDSAVGFTQTLALKLKGLKDKRTSVVMELLEDGDLLDVRHQNFSSNAGNEMLRLASHNAFGNSDNTNSNLLRNASAENLGIDYVLCDNCIVCGREPCIYPDCVFHQLVLFQTSTPNQIVHSRRRVRECLRHLMNSVKHLGNYELMSLSLIKE